MQQRVIQLNKILIENKNIYNIYDNYFIAIIEWGKTLSYFPQEVYDLIVRQFKSICDEKKKMKIGEIKENSFFRLLRSLWNLCPKRKFYK